MQDIDRRAKEEAKKTPACKDKWKNLRKSDFHIDYDWKNTDKYKNKDTEDYKNLGEGIWTPLKDRYSTKIFKKIFFSLFFSI